MTSKISFAFTHANLKIGGAEKLVLLAAFGLLKRGHNVTIYTSNYDPKNSLRLPNDDKFELIVYGRWIPETIFGRFHHLMAIIQMLWICLCISFSMRKFDVIINDQVPAINPILSCFSDMVIFYGHFPNRLLSQRQLKFPYTFYKSIMDYIEVKSTGLCDKFYVNSEFTKTSFENSKMSNLNIEVLYPPININDFENIDQLNPTDEELESVKEFINSPGPIFFSLNRYERKKSIQTAIEALAIVNKGTWKSKPKLIIAGGYDDRVAENVEYFCELEILANQYGLGSDQIIFLKSISCTFTKYLLNSSTALIYTPLNEHFGMVPCEAMAMGLPVIASNSGGLRESVINNKTGFLCEFSAADFASKISQIIEFYENSPQTLIEFGKAAKEHVKQKFCLDNFIDKLLEFSPSEMNMNK